MQRIVLIRGGGDLASGVALRLHRAGLRLVITELSQPLVVRRLVSFAEAIYRGQTSVEGVSARRADETSRIMPVLEAGEIAVIVDPSGETIAEMKPAVLIDGRMTKQVPDLGIDAAPLVIGLGPGFIAGGNCHAVVETQRGHWLGRVYWHGPALPDSGIPDPVANRGLDRVLRAPADGTLETWREIGDSLKAGQEVAVVAGQSILAPFDGVLRGLIHPGIPVRRGLKIGDLDPRNDPRYCTTVSDKSLAVGGGVLEAILSQPGLRSIFWEEC